MEFAFPTILLVPLALGVLGFVEPCTVGAHLIFTRTLAGRSPAEKSRALLAFAAMRAAVMGAVGGLAAVLGGFLASAQTTLWLAFGSLYLAIGLAYASGRIGWLRRRLDAAPRSWRGASNPVLLGVAFGLNIPACAAPILFALLALAAGSGAVALGVATMGLFGLALSAPLAVLLFVPLSRLPAWFDGGLTGTRWAMAAIFLLLGAWSIWFGLFVDPAAWAEL